jgi:glucose-6-phosphate 1-epimerase
MKQVLLKSPDGARAKIFLQGAHLASWHPVGCEEQLFLSKTSEIGLGKALRGGVPIIFPQFANRGPLAKHGFARTAIWELLHHGRINDHQAQAVLQLSDNQQTQAIWPHAFQASLCITLGGSDLQIELQLQNTGAAPFEFTSALHTYFTVENIASASVYGLAGRAYLDSTNQQMMDGDQDLIQKNDGGLQIQGEIDRVYADINQTAQAIAIRQAHQITHISQTGFTDLVLWNPGELKGAALVDLEPDGYQRFICIEAANALQAYRLDTGQTWCGTQRVKIETTV